ncbi:MAG: AAA family ATPase [Candidatus Sedimenticola sp. PURPLELP]
MYTGHFNLLEAPFSITPDPHFFFLSQAHQEALAHLVYGVLGDNDGFVLLTGEVGTGKTTVCRAFINQMPEHVDVALTLNPMVSVDEFLVGICDELRISIDIEQPTRKQLVDHLNRHLLDAHVAGRRVVLIVDEAQNLSVELLEQIRLLTNLETEKHKLLQVYLVGQPELRDLVGRKDLRQLSQRITARYHLEPLDKRETSAYIRHRIKVAGSRQIDFSSGALGLIYRATRGTPRLINILCDRSLLSAYTNGQQKVNRKIVKIAMKDMQLAVRMPLFPRLAIAGAVFVVGSTLLAGGVYRTELQQLMAGSEPEVMPVAPVPQPSADTPAVESGNTQALSNSQQAVPVAEEMAAEMPGDEVASNPVADQQENTDLPAAVDDDALQEDTIPLESTALSSSPAMDPLPRQDAARTADSEGSDVFMSLDPVAAVTQEVSDVQPLELLWGAEEPVRVAYASSLKPEQSPVVVREPVVSLFQAEDAPAAFQFLARGWNLRLEGDDYSTFCDSMSGHGLRCFQETGSIERITLFDRLALVGLLNDGKRHTAVLTGYDGERVSLLMGDEQISLTIAEFNSRRWSRDYLILWKPPEGFVTALYPGRRSRMAVWVNETLNTLDGGGRVELADIIDPADVERIKNLQRSNRLSPDGIVGTRTVLVMQNQRSDSSGPRLSDSTL